MEECLSRLDTILFKNQIFLLKDELNNSPHTSIRLSNYTHFKEMELYAKSRRRLIGR